MMLGTTNIKFTLPSLFLYASWIRHTSSGPALAVCLPISKYCTMGLLSRAFCGVPPCLNFENMAVAGIGDTRLRTAATRYRVGALGLAYEQLNVARKLRSCVSSAVDRPTVFTLTCSERETDRWGRHCSSAQYTFLYFQIFCGLSVVLTDSKNTTFYLKNISQHFFIHKLISEQDHNCGNMLQVAIHTVSCISRNDKLQMMFKMWTISFDISERTSDTHMLRVI